MNAVVVLPAIFLIVVLLAYPALLFDRWLDARLDARHQRTLWARDAAWARECRRRDLASERGRNGNATRPSSSGPRSLP